MAKLIVKDQTIKTINKDGIDYICITDIAKQKNGEDPNGVIGNWMRNRNTIEFLGIWESLYNPNFNPIEFGGGRPKMKGNLSFLMISIGTRGFSITPLQCGCGREACRIRG